MDEISELRQEVKRLTQTVSALEKKLSEYETDGPASFERELNRWVVNAAAYMREKSGNIKELLTGDNKDFERTLALIKSTKENKESLTALRAILPPDPNKPEDTRTPFIDSIADKRN